MIAGIIEREGRVYITLIQVNKLGLYSKDVLQEVRV